MAKLFANREDPDQTPHILRRLIWVCTVANYPFRGLQTTMDQTHTRKPSAFSEKGWFTWKGVVYGLGLDDVSLAWPAVVQLLVFIYSGMQ